MKSNLIISVFLFIILTTCSHSYVDEMNGLWIVQKVKVGNNEKTPVARWVRLNRDFTQQSGNGWYQHSVGVWEYNPGSRELKITNTNGYVDNYSPFKVTVEKNTMLWNRNEDGQDVEVTLKKSGSIPSSPGDMLMGVWDLTKAVENDSDVTAKLDPENKRYIYYRWDKVFVIQHTPEGKLSGVYNTNGHAPEMVMIYDGNSGRENWRFVVKTDSLTLTSIDPGRKTQLQYKRINYFPD